MITGLSHLVVIRRTRACPAIVCPGTPVGPVPRPPPGPTGPPPPRLPPAPHPRPADLRQAHPSPGVRLRLPPHRRRHLLGNHAAPPPRRVDQRGDRRPPAPGGACRLPAAVRPGAGTAGGGRLHHQ